jgi:hypothetical protein
MTAACGGRDPILIDRLGYARPLQDELVTIPHALRVTVEHSKEGPGPAGGHSRVSDSESSQTACQCQWGMACLFK